MFNISELKTKIRAGGGLLRTNKFSVSLALPKALTGSSYESLLEGGKLLTFYAEEAVIPGVTLQNDDVSRYGYGIVSPNPHKVVFADIPLVMRADGNGNVWRFFSAWMSSAINFQAQNGLQQTDSAGKQAYEVAYKDEYAVTVTIQAFKDNGKPSNVGVNLRQAYPSFVSDTPLRWGAKNEYMRFHVNMTYLDWYPSRQGL